MIRLICINDALLGEMDALLDGPVGTHYGTPCGEIFSSSIGQHLRHCIEHYEELFRALHEDSTANYESRPRDPQLEQDPGLARTRIGSLRKALAKLAPGRRGLRVRDQGPGPAADSSIERELQFLASHTVHHFALIALIARRAGLPVPVDFGMAPSTLRFRDSA